VSSYSVETWEALASFYHRVKRCAKIERNYIVPQVYLDQVESHMIADQAEREWMVSIPQPVVKKAKKVAMKKCMSKKNFGQLLEGIKQSGEIWSGKKVKR